MNLKKGIIITISVIAVIIVGYIAYMFLTTRSHSPAETVEYEDGGFKLSIDYCRPYKKDRLIFGEESEGALVPYNTYWRTGANEATEIEFNRDVKVEGKDLEAGRYRFYTIPGSDSWVIGFNSELDKWGYKEPNYDLDILTVNVQPQSSDEFSEQFTIIAEQEGDNSLVLYLKWDATEVPVQISY